MLPLFKHQVRRSATDKPDVPASDGLLVFVRRHDEVKSSALSESSFFKYLSHSDVDAVHVPFPQQQGELPSAQTEVPPG